MSVSEDAPVFLNTESTFGSEPGETGFNAITKEFKANPTIENYVRLRRGFVDKEIEVATTGGIEFVFTQEKQLRALGFDPLEITAVLDADPEAHAELPLKLMERLIEREKKQKSGATHLVSRKESISDGFVNYLIACALDSLSWNDELTISRELIVLIKYQLGVRGSAYEIKQAKKDQRFQALLIAAQIAGKGENPTYRKIASILGVQASTVMRWFAGDDSIHDKARLDSILKLLKTFHPDPADCSSVEDVKGADHSL